MKILEKDLTLAESKTKEMNNELTSDGTSHNVFRLIKMKTSSTLNHFFLPRRKISFVL